MALFLIPPKVVCPAFNQGFGQVIIQLVTTEGETNESVTISLLQDGNTIQSISGTAPNTFTFFGVANGYYDILVGSANFPDINGGVTVLCSDTPPCNLFFNNQSFTKVNDINGQGVGKITVHATSSFPIEYQLEKNNVVIYAWQSSNLFENLISGDYVIKIRDSNSCTNQSSTTLENTPCSLSVSLVSITNETSVDGNNGSVTFSASSAAGGVVANLNNGSNQSELTFNGLPPGIYTAYFSDASGCQSSINFSINEYIAPPDDPIECFDPNLVISDVIPYKFVLTKCNELDNTETLFRNTPKCFIECFFQPVNCDDVFTLQIFYQDEEYESLPILEIINFDTEALLYTFEFTSLNSGFYKLEKNISELPNLCEKRVYLSIKSKSSLTGNVLFGHAVSEPLHISNYHNCNLLLEYWNDSDYRGVLYEETHYVNKLRLEATIEEDDYPQTMDVYVKSNGERVKYNEEIIESWLFEVGYYPPYIHKIIALALSHDNVRIGNILLIQEEPYSFNRLPKYALARGSGKLITKNYQSKNLIK